MDRVYRLLQEQKKDTKKQMTVSYILDFFFFVNYNPVWKRKPLNWFIFLYIVFYNENLYLQVHDVFNLCTYIMDFVCNIFCVPCLSDVDSKYYVYKVRLEIFFYIQIQVSVGQSFPYLRHYKQFVVKWHFLISLADIEFDMYIKVPEV